MALGKGRAPAHRGYFAWQLWLTLAAPGKIAGSDDGAGKRARTLPFPPERSMFAFQEYGASPDAGQFMEVRG